jgi:hypothetical protein
MRLIEIEPGRFRFARERTAPARSELPCPHIISDEMPPVEQVDGRFYTSKARFRAVGRDHGLTEVGNEKPRPVKRSTDQAKVKTERRHALRRAIERYGAGERGRR